MIVFGNVEKKREKVLNWQKKKYPKTENEVRNLGAFFRPYK